MQYWNIIEMRSRIKHQTILFCIIRKKKTLFVTLPAGVWISCDHTRPNYCTIFSWNYADNEFDRSTVSVVYSYSQMYGVII